MGEIVGGGEVRQVAGGEVHTATSPSFCVSLRQVLLDWERVLEPVQSDADALTAIMTLQPAIHSVASEWKGLVISICPDKSSLL